jgi:hypothetical protein
MRRSVANCRLCRNLFDDFLKYGVNLSYIMIGQEHLVRSWFLILSPFPLSEMVAPPNCASFGQMFVIKCRTRASTHFERSL